MCQKLLQSSKQVMIVISDVTSCPELVEILVQAKLIYPFTIYVHSPMSRKNEALWWSTTHVFRAPRWYHGPELPLLTSFLVSSKKARRKPRTQTACFPQAEEQKHRFPLPLSRQSGLTSCELCHYPWWISLNWNWLGHALKDVGAIEVPVLSFYPMSIGKKWDYQTSTLSVDINFAIWKLIFLLAPRGTLEHTTYWFQEWLE